MLIRVRTSPRLGHKVDTWALCLSSLWYRLSNMTSDELHDPFGSPQLVLWAYLRDSRYGQHVSEHLSYLHARLYP